MHLVVLLFTLANRKNRQLLQQQQQQFTNNYMYMCVLCCVILREDFTRMPATTITTTTTVNVNGCECILKCAQSYLCRFSVSVFVLFFSVSVLEVCEKRPSSTQVSSSALQPLLPCSLPSIHLSIWVSLTMYLDL